jgi:DtxR family Mn-dependent transcriptional regulator
MNLDGANMSDAVEDYLKAIYQIEDVQGIVTTSDLADQVGVAAPSVTSMLKRLERLALVDYTPYHGVRLTAAGREAALQTVRNHRLAELFLVEVLGLPWERVHDEAHKWEHVLSESVAARMEAVLGYPSFDPHGDPIPSAAGEIPRRELVPLTLLEVGQSALVARVTAHDSALLQYLGELGLYPQTRLTLIAKAPFAGPVTVRIGDQRHVLAHAVAQDIRVTSHHQDGSNSNSLSSDDETDRQ